MIGERAGLGDVDFSLASGGIDDTMRGVEATDVVWDEVQLSPEWSAGNNRNSGSKSGNNNNNTSNSSSLFVSRGVG